MEQPAPEGAARRERRKAPADPVRGYVDDVLAGRLLAGPHVRGACERHLRDLADGPSRGLLFDTDRALYYIAFFEEFLRLNGGQFEGRPFKLQPWQKFIVGSLFGWVWKASGLRRFQTAFLEIAKGNGKSPLAAGIGIAGLIIDAEPRAEIYTAATKKDQAMILFRDAVAMVRLSPEIGSRVTLSGVGERVWNIAYPAMHSFFRPISSDDGQSGPRPHISLVDEVHEHKDPNVLEMLRRGVKGRRQPLIVETTNSGVDRTSICYTHHEQSVRVVHARPGEAGFDDTWFSYVCALDDGDDWMEDPSCWGKANPNLGVSITEKYLADAVREARNMPSMRNNVARLNFCVWTDAVSVWIGRESWEAVGVSPPPLASMRGRECFAGVDLSMVRDLTAAAYFFPDGTSDIAGDAFVEFWTPSEGLRERERRDKAPYELWTSQGHLRQTPGASVDYGSVAKRLAELDAALDIRLVAYDRWRIKELKRALDELGIELDLAEFGQGFKDMSPALQALETAILNKRLRIWTNPVLTWNASSVVTEQDSAGNRKFCKRKATGRIDGIVALAMAVGVSVGRAKKKSVYETRGLRSL